MADKSPRHILSLSGGKDSSALAIYMRDRVPEMEYAFCDTGKELPETYEYLARIEAYLGKPVIRLNSDRGFDHWLEMYGGYLPSSRMRWCTRQLKLKPFETYVGSDEVISYVGIRADEDREGYISTKPNIKAVFPFKEDGIVKADVIRILEESGVGMPSYYEWRSRSGCFFCFFQQKNEWLGLKERHPELFEAAQGYEKTDTVTGQRYSWQPSETLDELIQPERMAEIKAKAKGGTKRRGGTLLRVLTDSDEDDDEDRPCLICEL
jgi:3'-phosphoadenosine 5'-phosphosulfate sulfotransferase (PAPS reductase)/FAD synthetase